VAITVRLIGGLGNQMFQYAVACSLAARRDTEVALDLAWFDQSDGDTRRTYALDAFAGPAASPRASSAPGAVVRERSFAYDPGIAELLDGSVLSGFFQSERYFCEHAAVIRTAFSFCDGPDHRNRSILGLIGSCESVAVHVRRGDYASDPASNAHHGLLPLGYYRDAATEVSSRVGAPKFFVFSDDPQWCRSALSFLGEAIVVDHNPVERGAEDLRLMAACRHHILANSTFSWWGAWLATRSEQVVVAPRRWFADASVDTADLCPSRWMLR